jgi:hypothetical protein
VAAPVRCETVVCDRRSVRALAVAAFASMGSLALAGAAAGGRGARSAQLTSVADATVHATVSTPRAARVKLVLEARRGWQWIAVARST